MPENDGRLAVTYVATMTLAEAETRRLAADLGDDEALGCPTTAATELAPERWELALYFSERPNARRLKQQIAAALGRPAARLPKLAIKPLPEEDWVAKSLAGLAPVTAGRFLVYGAHDRARLLPNQFGIKIEAGRAFGTGHHGTTRGCLLMLERLARQVRIANPLDLGTGSGVLAIAIAKLWRVPVLAADIDPVATAVATENARANGVAGLVETATADGFADPAIRARAPYDLIVANILAGPLITLAADVARHTRSGGTAILSGILEGQRDRVLAAFRAHGFVRAESYLEDGWVTLRLAYRPARRKRAAPSGTARDSLGLGWRR